MCHRNETECHVRKVKGMYLCPKHLTQYYRHNQFLNSTIYDKNEYVIDDIDGYCYILLKDKNGNELDKTIINYEDLELCKKYKWHIKYGVNTNYAVSSFNNKKIFLHRLITNCPDGFIVDHKNHNGLDNRRNNLVISNHSKNGANRLKETVGIQLTKSGRYSVSIMKDYKHNYVGTYDTLEEAIFERKRKYKELFE